MDIKQFRKYLAEANPKTDARERQLTRQCAKDMSKTVYPLVKALLDFNKEWVSLTDSSTDNRAFKVGQNGWPFKSEDAPKALHEFLLWLAKVQEELKDLQK